MMKQTRLRLTVIVLLVNATIMVMPLNAAKGFAPGTARTYNPPQIGIASFYSYECADQPMANGKMFDPEKRTCASWFYEFGTVLVVKSLDTGQCTEAVVTDRGPNKRLVRRGRIIDLSKRAFEDICDLDKGLTRIEVRAK